MKSGQRKGPARVQRRSFAQMCPPEIAAWIASVRAALQEKMQRERAYLDRRATWGVSTPTDEAYEADQLLEADLLRLLDEMERVLERGGF